MKESLNFILKFDVVHNASLEIKGLTLCIMVWNLDKGGYFNYYFLLFSLKYWMNEQGFSITKFKQVPTHRQY